MYTTGGTTLCCHWCGISLDGASQVTYLNGNLPICGLCLLKAVCENVPPLKSVCITRRRIMKEEYDDIPDEVALIASGYEWICPVCELLKKEIEVTETVACKKCKRTFTVIDYHHAIGYKEVIP